MKIRKLEAENLNQVLKISQASFPKPWPRGEFEKYFKDSFVAEENEKVIGFIVGKISGDIGYIKLIAIDPTYRGKGIGRKIIERLLNHLKENGTRRVFAHARTKNEVGVSFLKNFGFEIVKTIKNYYPDGDDAYLMKKEMGA
jgi:ribosomal-protein-alanine N-acetyltransferase